MSEHLSTCTQFARRHWCCMVCDTALTSLLLAACHTDWSDADKTHLGEELSDARSPLRLIHRQLASTLCPTRLTPERRRYDCPEVKCSHEPTTQKCTSSLSVCPLSVSAGPCLPHPTCRPL